MSKRRLGFRIRRPSTSTFHTLRPPRKVRKGTQENSALHEAQGCGKSPRKVWKKECEGDWG
eukprot:3764418-Pyramimonas_sp.AAC.1